MPVSEMFCGACTTANGGTGPDIVALVSNVGPVIAPGNIGPAIEPGNIGPVTGGLEITERLIISVRTRS